MTDPSAQARALLRRGYSLGANYLVRAHGDAAAALAAHFAADDAARAALTEELLLCCLRAAAALPEAERTQPRRRPGR